MNDEEVLERLYNRVEFYSDEVQIRMIVDSSKIDDTIRNLEQLRKESAVVVQKIAEKEPEAVKNLKRLKEIIDHFKTEKYERPRRAFQEREQDILGLWGKAGRRFLSKEKEGEIIALNSVESMRLRDWLARLQGL